MKRVCGEGGEGLSPRERKPEVGEGGGVEGVSDRQTDSWGGREN